MFVRLEYLDLDCKIILEMISCALKKTNANTWDMSKKFFTDLKFDNYSQRKNFYIKKNVLIKRRLESMAKEGLIKIEKNDKKIYILNGDKVRIVDKKMSDGKIHNCLELKNQENKFIIYEV